MSISIWTVYNSLAVKVNAGPTFNRDKAKINSISGRTPRYKADKFSHWEIPKTSFLEIYNNFSDDEMQIADDTKDFVAKFTSLTSRLKDLPKIPLNVSRYDGEKLYDHQVDWITADSNRLGLLNLCDTGLGKGSMCLLRSLNLGMNKIIIISPKPVITEWVNEIKNKILGPEAKFIKYLGSPAQRKKIREKIKDFDIVITNYEMVGELVKFDVDKSFGSIIIDEAHNIKNRTTKLYKDCKSLVKRCKGSVQLLTATPMEDTVKHIWTLINLVNPDLAGDEKTFLNKFQEETAWVWKPGKNGRKFKVAIKFKTKNEAELKDLLSRAGMRVRKELFINYGIKSNVIPVELTNRQRERYEDLREQILIDCQTDGFYKSNPLVRLLDLLKIAEGDTKDSGKLDYIEYRIADMEKAIIASRFLWMPEHLHSKYPATSVLYNGSKSEQYREMVKWCFEGCPDSDLNEFYVRREKMPDFAGFEPGSARWLFMTYSGRSGAGLNLPSSQYILTTSFDYSSSSLKQLKGRNARMQSEFDEVFTDYVVSEDTIESMVLSRILAKMERNSRILDGESSEESMTAREVIQILQGV